jgi:ribonuclease P/MRP protein subunit POP5
MLNLKPLRPSLREKKRYLVYEMEVFNNSTEEDKSNNKPKMYELQNSLINEVNKLLGVFDSAKAGLKSIQTDENSMRGIIKVNYLFVDKLKASMVLIDELKGLKVRVSSLGVSGILKKARLNYLSKQ